MAAIASRVGPSLLFGLNRCRAAVSQPFCCIHRKWVFTLCWSKEENRVAAPPPLRLAYAVWYPVAYSVMSGHALIALLHGEGGWLQFWLQCHQPLIGAPSPMQANHPW